MRKPVFQKVRRGFSSLINADYKKSTKGYKARQREASILIVTGSKNDKKQKKVTITAEIVGKAESMVK
jgi:hypothetical protein